MTWRRVRVETVALETRDTIDPQSLECPLVEHYSIPSLEATGLPELVPPDEILSAKQVLRGGEVMVSRLNPRKARVLRVPEKLDQPTIASGEFVVMQPSDVDGDFLTLVLLSEDVRQHLHSCVQSVTRSHQRIRPDHLLKMFIRIPEFETQIAIRNYVDSETARIDRLTTMQESLIERLDEYRTALVTQVVTKGLPPGAAEAAGLDPEPALKDSGVEWLGEVPEHWGIGRLKWSTAGCIGGVWGEEPDGVNDLLCVRVADFDRHAARVSLLNPTQRSVSMSHREGRLLNVGDLLLEKSGGGIKQLVGCVVLYDHEVPAVCSNFVGRVPPAEDAHPAFWAYVHRALYAGRLNYPAIKQTTGIQNLHTDAYFDTPAVFPPHPEQIAIAGYLDDQSGRIDALRAKAELSIERLREYRSALISAAVTGKIDVRESVLAGAGDGV